MPHPRFSWVAAALLAASLSACSTREPAAGSAKALVSIPDQKLVLIKNTDDGFRPVATYDVSTSRFCISTHAGSNGTPLGKHEVSKKIGSGLPNGAVMKSRRATGEVLRPDAPGRDPIVTRILWLNGLEPENKNSFERHIYIHGTPEERMIGRPASFGCIRMRSKDVAELYTQLGVGAEVDIVNRPIMAEMAAMEAFAEAAAKARLAATKKGVPTPAAEAGTLMAALDKKHADRRAAQKAALAKQSTGTAVATASIAVATPPGAQPATTPPNAATPSNPSTPASAAPASAEPAKEGKEEPSAAKPAEPGASGPATHASDEKPPSEKNAPPAA
jgi:hypothetical protein